MADIPLPWSYVYRYPDGALRMSGGREINGSRPVEAIGVYLAPTLEAAEARVRELEAEVSGVSAAIGTTRFMDPPDGGSVTLSEQVARMRQSLDAAEGRLSTIKSETIERCAKVAKEIAEKHGKWKGDRLMKEAAEEVAFAVRKLAQEVR